MNSRKLNVDGNFCYWCGKEMKSNYDYSEREEWYTCDCTKAKKYDQLRSQIFSIDGQMRAMKQEASAIEKLYQYKLEKLKRDIEISKRDL